MTYDAPGPARRAGIVLLRHERVPKVLMPRLVALLGHGGAPVGHRLDRQLSTRSTGAGHFAAWEDPQLFSEEVRAAFGSLRWSERGGVGHNLPQTP